MNKEIDLTGEYQLAKLPCQRVILNNIQSYVHALSFADYANAKMLAIHYTMKKDNRSDFHNVKPDPEIMKLCQIMLACKQEAYGSALTFTYKTGGEVEAIDNMKNFLQSPRIVEFLCSLSDELSTASLIPLKDEKRIEQESEIREFYVETFNDPETYEHLNYFAVKLLGRPLNEIADKTAGDVLNLIIRDEHMENLVVETFSHMAQLMVKV